jgi:hypothetical protein
MATPGQVHSVTIGAFTVSDADQPGGAGCLGVSVTDNSKTDYYIGNGNGGTWSGETPPSTVFKYLPAGYHSNNLFQAVLVDGSSMATGDVADVNGPTTASGNTPCYDVGGVAGQ